MYWALIALPFCLAIAAWAAGQLASMGGSEQQAREYAREVYEAWRPSDPDSPNPWLLGFYNARSSYAYHRELERLSRADGDRKYLERWGRLPRWSREGDATRHG